MKKLILSLFLLGLTASAFGQGAAITQTTLSAKVDSSSTFVVVASATGITANNTYLYVDGELLIVQSVNSTTLNVVRGQGGTNAAAHANAAPVFVGPATAFIVTPAPNPQGACTRSNSPYLPVIDVRTATFFDCLGGQWVAGQTVRATPFRLQIPDTGGTAYTSLNSTGTTLSATTMYCTELNLPFNKLITGLGVLNGTTVGTDKHLVALYDSAGTLLANSATAGLTSASASTYQNISFTTPFYAVGPQQYFGCVQTNGTTDTIRMIVTGTQDIYLTKGQTGVTFGTIPALTVPTTFTTAVGPYLSVF